MGQERPSCWLPINIWRLKAQQRLRSEALDCRCPTAIVALHGKTLRRQAEGFFEPHCRELIRRKPHSSGENRKSCVALDAD